MKILKGAATQAAALALGLVLAGTGAQAAEISGAGATFPYPIYAKWADAYKTETGNSLNYQSIGSGGGIKQIKAKTVTFGASDKPLEKQELDAAGLVQWPMIMGAVVPIVNLAGVEPGALVLDGKTLADIFLGKITSWDDPAIKALNPKAALPDAAIAVVHRSDGSGTTFNFADYLSKVSGDWKSSVGADTSVQWPVGIGAKGNEGVASMVKQTADSIGYVEFAYAKQNQLAFTRMTNRDGQVVTPGSASFQAAAANADWSHTPGYHLILTDQPGAQSWPITAASFILMYSRPQDPKAAAEALKFFDWAYRNGGAMAEELDYIPMPDSVVQLVEHSWRQEIKGSHGEAIDF